MPTKADRPKIPAFSSEAEEARWWDDHAEMVEEELIKAIQDGTVGRGAAARLARKARAAKGSEPESQEITLSIAPADLERARRLSAEKSVAYQSYLATLLHEALKREDSAGD